MAPSRLPVFVTCTLAVTLPSRFMVGAENLHIRDGESGVAQPIAERIQRPVSFIKITRSVFVRLVGVSGRPVFRWLSYTGSAPTERGRTLAACQKVVIRRTIHRQLHYRLRPRKPGFQNTHQPADLLSPAPADARSSAPAPAVYRWLRRRNQVTLALRNSDIGPAGGFVRHPLCFTDYSHHHIRLFRVCTASSIISCGERGSTLTASSY